MVACKTKKMMPKLPQIDKVKKEMQLIEKKIEKKIAQDIEKSIKAHIKKEISRDIEKIKKDIKMMQGVKKVINRKLAKK